MIDQERYSRYLRKAAESAIIAGRNCPSATGPAWVAEPGRSSTRGRGDRSPSDRSDSSSPRKIYRDDPLLYNRRSAMRLQEAPSHPKRWIQSLFLTALAVQILILVFYIRSFWGGMFHVPSTLGRPLTPALAGEIAILAGVAAAARLWGGGDSEAFAAAALAHLGGLALFHGAIGLAEGRLYTASTPLFLGLSILAASVRKFRNPSSFPTRAPLNPALTAWDIGSLLILFSLLIPAVFPYNVPGARIDALYIWACRAFALQKTPSFAAFAGCAQPFPRYPGIAGPGYPPAWSILLWLGVGDPIFEGRLMGVVLLALFAIFFRARLSRLNAALAPAALLFTLATVRVWEGIANCCADVPLMVFLTTGSLLVLGFPKTPSRNQATAKELAAGTLCLGAGVLTRPDGLYYMAVIAAAALWNRWRLKEPSPLWPFIAAAAGAAAWKLWSPPILHVAPHYLSPNVLWRAAGANPWQAAAKLFWVFFYGLQGQWLSHRGFGVAFYILGGLALWRWRCGIPDDANARFFGLASSAFLVAVALCFLLMPYVGNPTVSAEPQMSYAEGYLLFIRTGLGRVTSHLYPLLVLWGVSVMPKNLMNR